MVYFSTTGRRGWPDVFLSSGLLLAGFWAHCCRARSSRPAAACLGDNRRRTVPAVSDDEYQYSQGCWAGCYFSRGVRCIVLVPDSGPQGSVGGRRNFDCLAFLRDAGAQQCGLCRRTAIGLRDQSTMVEAPLAPFGIFYPDRDVDGSAIRSI